MEKVDDKKMMEHVVYEINMYVGTLIRLNRLHSELSKDGNDMREELTFQNNMAFESHMVHLRNLLEFFNYKEEEKKAHDDDIWYTDFFEKDSLKKEEVDNLKEVIFPIIHKTISHLSKERIKDDAKEKQIKIINDVSPRMIETIERFNELVIKKYSRSVWKWHI